MQPVTNPPAKPVNRIGTFLLLCCLGGVVVIAVMRTLGPTVNTPTQVTQPIIGATVEFIGPTDRPEPTDTPIPPPLGITRDQPFPVDAVVDIGGGMHLSIIFVTRPADEIVGAGNRFNDTPEPNQEYILIALRLECTKTANETCNFNTFQIKTVGINGLVHDRASVSGIPNEMEYSSEFFGGAAVEGSMVFLATLGDTNTVLFYDPLIFGDPIYIALQ